MAYAMIRYYFIKICSEYFITNTLITFINASKRIPSMMVVIKFIVLVFDIYL